LIDLHADECGCQKKKIQNYTYYYDFGILTINTFSNTYLKNNTIKTILWDILKKKLNLFNFEYQNILLLGCDESYRLNIIFFYSIFFMFYKCF